jgi:hypothetical protein
LEDWGRLACASPGKAKAKARTNRPKRKQIRNVMAISVCMVPSCRDTSVKGISIEIIFGAFSFCGHPWIII